MALILLIALGFALAMFPTLRCAVFHPVSLVRFGVMDLLDHFKHHEYDRCGSGELVAYTGLFGKGKTLSAVHILKLQQNSQQSGMDGVARPSRRWLKLRRQQRK